MGFNFARKLLLTFLVLAVRPAVSAVPATVASTSVSSTAGASKGMAAPPLPDAYEYAFRFASSIASDVKDRTAAQQAVVEDVAAAGALEEAVRMAAAINGWRQGAAYATVAQRYAVAGKSDRAAELLVRTRAIRASVNGWPVARLDAMIAEVNAALGHAEAAKQLARDVAASDPRQYEGRAAATAAAAAAAHGDFATAMTTLREMDGDADVEIARWRTDGYEALARDSQFTVEQRKAALEAAARSSETLFGWQRSEAIERIAKQAKALGSINRVREALAAGEANLVPADGRTSPAIACGLARAWATLGEKARARALLERAEESVPYEQDINQPGVHAFLAGGWRAIGEDAEVARLYGKALTGAESLKNARPRALAAVEICRSLGRSGTPLSADVKQRLDFLLKGLAAAKS